MKQTKNTRPAPRFDAVEETLRLYHAWLAVLLSRLNQGEIRVSAEDIKNALGKLRCQATREGDTYVIRMGEALPHTEDVPRDEVTHGASV